MKNAGIMKRFILLAALILCLAPAAALAEEMPMADGGEFPNAIGEVVYIMGSVKAEQPDGTVRVLDLHKQVIPQDVIVTGMKSNVEIVFKDDSVFSQGSDSRTSLDDYVYSEDASASKLLFTMGEGTFRYVTGKVVKQNPDAFALKTPTTTIGIRGTEVFAEVTPEEEEVGVVEMTAGHIVNVRTPVSNIDIDRPGFSTRIDRATGKATPPAPTSPDTRKRVLEAAPQTTQGESGTIGSTEDDLQRKVDAFAAVIDRTKGTLGSVSDRPDYGQLHTISLQQVSEDNAQNEQDSGGAGGAGLGSDGGGGGGGY